MAVYMEEEIWKCPKHPSTKRRRSSNGICSICLRDRLISLCPDCANVRPCSCSAAATTSSSSASSSTSTSSFHFFSSASSSSRGGGGRVSDLIDGETSFRRSRSVGIPFLFTRFATQQQKEKSDCFDDHQKVAAKTPSFWSKLNLIKSKRRVVEDEIIEEKNTPQPKELIFRNDSDSCDESNVCRKSNTSIEEFGRMMMKSRSVHVSMMSGSDGKSSAGKGKGWSFPSPMKVFRHSSKTPKVVQDRSPLHRG